MSQQLGPQPPVPDAIVIISPKVMLDRNPSRDELAEAGRAECPVFYLNYSRDPDHSPWRDAIGTALTVYHGAEYTISAPRDLVKAVDAVLNHLRAAH